MEVSTRGDQIELKCGRSHFKLNGLPADDFPKLAEIDFSRGRQRNGEVDLNGLIHHTSFAVSTEESRPILNGVLWELRDGEMKMVATNGHRLATNGRPRRVDGTAVGGLHRAPRRARAGAASLQGRRHAGGGEARATTSDSEPTRRRCIRASSTGTYPNYDQVIPRDNDKVAIGGQEGARVRGPEDGRGRVGPDTPDPAEVRAPVGCT